MNQIEIMIGKFTASWALRRAGLCLLLLGALFPNLCLAAVLPPVITSQPSDQAVYLHNSATFQVTVSSLNTLSYQWRKNGTNISGANSNSYTIASVQLPDQASYSVLVTNLGGSATSSNATLAVLANLAPTLSGAADLSPITEDPASNPGIRVSDLISGQVTDPDSGAQSGIGVISANNTYGKWQFSTNSGGGWIDFVNSSTPSGRLLTASNYVRFVPNINWNGTVTNGLTFRAWDQTSGTAGGLALLRTNGTMLDTFSAVSYSNNDGTDLWNGGWVDVDGSTAGRISVSVPPGTLSVQANKTTDWIYRDAFLVGVSSATVSFDYDNGLNGSSGGRIEFQVSSNGGTNYTTLAAFSATNNANIGSFSADITAYASAKTRIRFQVTGSSSPTRNVDFDNVQIAYTASFGGLSALSSDTASSSVTVTPINDTPVANPQSVSTPEDTVRSITLTSVDPDGPATNYTLLSQPAHGALNGTAPNLTYIPTTNYNGSDSFTFSVNDGSLTSVVATVSITVTSVNDAPVASGDAYTLNQNTVLTNGAPGVLANDTDVEGSALSAIKVAGPAHGTLVLSANGAFSYTPVSNYFGGDSFTYRASDGTSNSAVTTVILTIIDTTAVVTNTPLTLASTGMTTNGFVLQLSGPVGGTYVILASPDLKNWTPISTNVAPSGTVDFTDTTATSRPIQYYRAVLQ